MKLRGCAILGILLVSTTAGAQDPVAPVRQGSAILREGAARLVVAPDLVVSEVRQDPGDPVQLNRQVTFTVTIRNQGAADAVFPPASRFLSAFGVSRANSTGSAAIIRPGQTSVFVFHWLLNQPGASTMPFKVDPDNVVAESNETNNEKSENYLVVATGKPDLVIESMVTEPVDPRLTDNIKLRVAIRNQGMGVASITGDRLVLASVGTRDAPLPGYMNVRLSGSMNLAPGASETRVVNVLRPTAGTHKIRVMVDPEHLVDESDESNNERAIPVTIADVPLTARPDLVIASIGLDPPNPAATDNWRFEVTLKNQGKVSAQIPQGLGYMARRYPSENNWTGITRSVAISIPPGGTFVGHQYPGIGRRAGTNTVHFLADPDDVVSESNESNNQKIFTYTIR